MIFRQALAMAALVAASLFAVACAGGGSGSAEKKPRKRTVLATEYDDVTVGQRAAAGLSTQMGIYDDPELNAYVAEVGRRMLRHTISRPFDYSFQIVDQAMPNAFALPGGHVYVSRGLLALASNETELANVLGHEITHAAERHAAAQQQMARRTSPLQMPIVRMGKLAAYGRAQENDADRGGQQIAAAAGYDPAGLPSFLRRLGDLERLRVGSRMPSYLSTHPGTVERVATTTQRAGQLTVRPGKPVAADALGYLKHVEGIVVGANPAEGIFRGSRFMHPSLGFQILFPDKWNTVNDHQTVGATSPDGRAVVFLTVEGKAEDPQKFAERFIEERTERFRLKILRDTPIKIAGIDCWRIAATGKVNGRSATAQLTFIPYAGLMYRITAVAPSRAAENYVARARNTVRSFRPLPEEARGGFPIMRLRFTRALPRESIPAMMVRTGSAFRPGGIAVLNGVFVDHLFEGGELVKYVAQEVYAPSS